MAKTTKKQEGEEIDKLQETMKRLNATYGAGTIIAGNQKVADIKAISTGSLKVDIETGIGGLPCGRIIEIYGPESSGKTTVAIHVIANAQQDLSDLRKCAVVDMEHTIEPKYMQALGVDLDALI